MAIKCFWVILALTCLSRVANAQQDECYSGGSIVGAVFGTLFAVILLALAAYLFWKYYWKKQKGKELTLTAGDAEAGLGDQYAFDNPGFLTEDTPHKKPPTKAKPTTTTDTKAVETKNAAKDNRTENQKAPKQSGKWQAWSPLSALVGGGSGKQKDNRRTLDDSFIGEPERNVVALRGHDFTGLGFNICGNMRDGIFVRDVLHRGPASESGRITAGDRIIGINISFKHMVFEDALTILSYASPYDVQLEVEKSAPGSAARETGSGKRSPSVGPTDRLCHPFYRSQSIDDLAKMRRSSLSARRAKIKKSPSNSPGPVGVVGSPSSQNKEDSKLEQTSSTADNPRTSRTSVSMPKPERAKKPTNGNGKPATEEVKPMPSKTTSSSDIDKHTKFGVRVLPPNFGNIKLGGGGNPEATQNEQNNKIEQKTQNVIETKIHEIITDTKVKIEKAEEDIQKSPENPIKVMKIDEDVVDKNIPTEIPEEMRLAAMAAKTNRKSLSADKNLHVVVSKPEVPAKPDLDFSSGGEADGNDTPRKNAKRKAPPPPAVTPKSSLNNNSDSDDSDAEPGDKNAGKTIELNSAHITIHQSPKEDDDSDSAMYRKTASLGDLSRLESGQSMSIPLERAVSLDMADVTAPVATGSDPAIAVTAKKRKAPVQPGDDDDDMDREIENSDDEYSSHYPKKEPRLMDAVGMSDTFKRRLKKSSDWGTLEEALLVTSDPSNVTSSHQIVLVSGSEPSSLQSSTITSSNKSPLSSSSDVVSVQVVTSSENVANSPTSTTLQSVDVVSSTPMHKIDIVSATTTQTIDVASPTTTQTIDFISPSTTVDFVTQSSTTQKIDFVSPNVDIVTSPTQTVEFGSPTTTTRTIDIVSPMITQTIDIVGPTTTTRTIDVVSRNPEVDSSSMVELVSTSHATDIEPPELPTSPMPRTQIREFSLASPNNSPTSNFHHSMTYITTTTTSNNNTPAVSPQHHVTEIQVLTGGNVSTTPSFTTENAESTTSVRHGTSGGNLLLLPSIPGVLNGPESLEETLSSFTSTHSEVDDENVHIESPISNNVTVINTNGNHQEKREREVIKITPGELDSVMMSHSHYLQSTQASEPTTSGSSSFEKWVFLDNGTTPNGIRHVDKDDSEYTTKSNTTTMVVNLPNLQTVTHIMLESDSNKSDTEINKNKLNISQSNVNL